MQQNPTIPDKDIPDADPDQLIFCFSPWVRKISLNYQFMLDRTGAVDLDDLCQVGSLALLKAQKRYDPDRGSFLRFSWYYITKAIRQELGFSSDGRPPVFMEYLDEPLGEDQDLSKLDIIPDNSIEPNEARAERLEEYEELHHAVNRLKNDKKREIIQRVYFQEQTRKEAAAEMDIKPGVFYNTEREAINLLRKDRILKGLCAPRFSSSLSRFRQTWMSVIEQRILWEEEQVDRKLGKGAYLRKRTDTVLDP